jgi:hypothetical protein
MPISNDILGLIVVLQFAPIAINLINGVWPVEHCHIQETPIHTWRVDKETMTSFLLDQRKSTINIRVGFDVLVWMNTKNSTS